MSEALDANGNAAPMFLGTEQITSAPTADGQPAGVSRMELLSAKRAGENEPSIDELVLWDGRYSLWNFFGRIVWRLAATALFTPLAFVTWDKGRTDVAFFTILIGLGLAYAWVVLFYQILISAYSRHYTLTDRRLFISSGLFNSRKDQMELSRIHDVYTRRSLMERWLSLGTVVVVSTERELPVVSLTGVSEPDKIMDLIGKHAKNERVRLKLEV